MIQLPARLLRKWRGADAGLSPRSRTATGRPRPAWPRCATTASTRLRSAASAFPPTSSSSWSRPSSATTSRARQSRAPTKEKRCETRSRPPVPSLFLPKYSPDLNPIEQLFAKLKGPVRKAAPRTLDAVSAAIAQALTSISAVECANYFTGADCASA